MERVIKKWTLILQKDSGRDISYGRRVLEEMLIDVKKANENAPFCPYCGKKKRHLVYTDPNSPLVCRYPGCLKM